MKKRSFFDRLSGALPAGDDYDAYDDDYAVPVNMPQQRKMIQSVPPQAQAMPQHATMAGMTSIEEEQAEGQLPVDVYQTANEIVIRTFVAGVRADDINLSLSRDMVVIEGAREERDNVSDEDYFRRELFWGSFACTILLPQEVDVDLATAGSKDGLLTLVLPKLDKSRQTKLKVKAT
jgi:HSP20 family protein